MSINTNYAIPSSYTQASSLSSRPQTEQTAIVIPLNKEQKKTGGAGKAWASVAIPGLGQMLDGRTGKGLQFLGTDIGLGILSAAGIISLVKGAINAPAMRITTCVVSGLAFLGLLANQLWNIVDAYRGGKKE